MWPLLHQLSQDLSSHKMWGWRWQPPSQWLSSLLCQSSLLLWVGLAAGKYEVHRGPQLMKMKRALLSFLSWLARHQLAFQPISVQPRAFGLCPSVMSAHLYFPANTHSVLEKSSHSQPWMFSVPYQDPVGIPVNSYATILDVFGAFNFSWNWMNDWMNKGGKEGRTVWVKKYWNGYGTYQPWADRIRISVISSYSNN